LIDLLEDGDRREAVPGGSAANVALGLARRDIPVRLSTCLGRDSHGAQIAEFLAAEGVDLDPGSFTADRTSTALARRAASGDVEYTFDVKWELPDVDMGAPMSLLHLGSFPAMSSPLENVLDLLGAIRDRVPISWDPNIRPALAPNALEAQQRFHALLPRLDLVKLSDADAGYLLPGASPDEVVDAVLSQGARLVVLTLAEHGLLLATGLRRTRVPAAHVLVADTIGAGDTVMTSLIADVVQGRALLDGADDLDAIGHRAAVAAAITVSRMGADLPRVSELEPPAAPSKRLRNVAGSLDIGRHLS
jgi:fructokinase